MGTMGGGRTCAGGDGDAQMNVSILLSSRSKNAWRHNVYDNNRLSHIYFYTLLKLFSCICI